MGKKYLDTKQSTIEASVLDVWVDAADEREAIKDAARMFVGGAEFEEQAKYKTSPDSEQEKWRLKKKAAQEKADKEAKAAAKAAEDDKSPPADKSTALPKVPSGSDFLPGGDKRNRKPGQAIVIAPADVKAKIAKADAASGGEYDAAAQTSAQAAANAAQAAANVKAAADAITTAVKHDKKPAAGPTVDIKKLPQVAAPKAEPWVDPDKGKKAKAKVDPATQVQPGHRDYKQNPDKTYGPRHKWSRGKYAGSDDPRFSSDPRAGRGEPQVAHYQHELAVHEAIRDAANRMISEMEDPRGGGASGAIKTKRARDAERKRLGLDKPVPKFKGPTAPPGAAAPVGRVDVEPLGPLGPRPSPGALGGAAAKPDVAKPDTRRSPGALGGKAKPDTSARDYGGGPESKAKPDTRRSPGALGGAAAKPDVAKPDTRRSPGALGGKAPDTRRSPGALGGKVTAKPKTKPVMTKNKDGTYGPRHKWSRGKYAGSDDPRFSSDPSAGREEPVVGHYQPENGDYIEERENLARALAPGGRLSKEKDTGKGWQNINRVLGKKEPTKPKADDKTYRGPGPGELGQQKPKTKPKARPGVPPSREVPVPGGRLGRPTPKPPIGKPKPGQGPKLPRPGLRPPSGGSKPTPRPGLEIKPGRDHLVEPKPRPGVWKPKPRPSGPYRPSPERPDMVARPDRGGKGGGGVVLKPAPARPGPTKLGDMPRGPGGVKLLPYKPKPGDKRPKVKLMRAKSEETLHEVTGDKEEYTKFFNSAMKKFGVTSPDQLKGDKQKEFYDYVDANWEGDDEKAEQVVRDFKVNSMREALRQMWSQQNEEGDVGQRHPGSKPGVWKRSPGAMGGKSRKKTDTGGKPAVIDTKPKTGNPHY